MKTNKLAVRLICYLAGLFVMTMGIALSVKSNLGVSPVSSIPYTITCVFGIEMGRPTILFHIVLVVLQIIILRKDFKIKNLLQIAVGIVFGMFTTMCNTFVANIQVPDNLIIRLLMMCLSIVVIAFGIFLYVPTDIIPLAGEGVMLAIADVTLNPFPIVKICFDVTMVVASLITCLIVLHGLGSVGLGTVVAAVFVGVALKQITKILGSKRDKLLGRNQENIA